MHVALFLQVPSGYSTFFVFLPQLRIAMKHPGKPNCFRAFQILYLLKLQSIQYLYEHRWIFAKLLTGGNLYFEKDPAVKFQASLPFRSVIPERAAYNCGEQKPDTVCSM